MTEPPKIAPYDGPAGGWPALKSVSEHLLQQDIPVLGAKTLLSANQPDGFDCPGCAWPDREHTSTFEFCENGAKAVAFEATTRRVGPGFFAQYSVADLARYSDHWLEDQGRLTHPLRYNPKTDRYEAVSWDTAFRFIASKLNALASPDEAIFYTSGRTSNEAAFLYQLFVRQFGTNNFPDCSNMCHEPSGVALGQQIGVGKGTVHCRISRADAILVFGPEPRHQPSAHARRAAPGGEARHQRALHSTRCASAGWNASPTRRTRWRCSTGGSTKICVRLLPATHRRRPGRGHRHHQARAWNAARGRMPKASQPCSMKASSPTHTEGFDALLASVRAAHWRQIEAESGLSEERLRDAGERFLRSERAIVCWGMGITQHKRAVATIQMLVNLMLLRGHIGRPGAGDLPGARPQQRAGRPHHGHPRKARTRPARSSGRGVRFRAPTRAWRGRGRRDRGDARWPRQGVLRDGRQLRHRHAGYRGHPCRAAQLRPHRARGHQAQPQPPGPRQATR
jgi:anaerobic selenocysteine-containing dehydrogenase